MSASNHDYPGGIVSTSVTVTATTALGQASETRTAFYNLYG